MMGLNWRTAFHIGFFLVNTIFFLTNVLPKYQDTQEPLPRSAMVNQQDKDTRPVGVPNVQSRSDADSVSSLTSNQVQRKLQEGRVDVEPAVQTKKPVQSLWKKDWDNRQLAAELHHLSNGEGPIRRIWLIRHGDYHSSGAQSGHLTDKGRRQVENVGQRLKDIPIRFDSLSSSTSVRCKETTNILMKYLTGQQVQWDEWLKEGRPSFPEPSFPFVQTKDKRFDEDGVRFDMAFRKYIHRANVDQRHVTNELIVTHGNVIAYFTLRGLQVNTDRWLKAQVIQGSITMFEITTNGHFNLRIFGDMGHIPVVDWTG